LHVGQTNFQFVGICCQSEWNTHSHIRSPKIFSYISIMICRLICTENVTLPRIPVDAHNEQAFWLSVCFSGKIVNYEACIWCHYYKL